MKRLALAMCVSFAAIFSACGDDSSSPSGSDTELSSSSSDEDSENEGSSSSKNTSSSSGKSDSSSSAEDDEVSSSSEAGSVYDSTANTLKDLRDGQVYRTVTLGSQVWMAQNLNYETPEGKSYCYGKDTLNCEKYGRLYTWAALMDTLNTGYGYYKVGVKARGVCPMDWHVPTSQEWDTMLKKFNYGSGSGNGALMAEVSEWDVDDEDLVYTDEYGFSALPAGQWDGYDRDFADLKKYAYFWTSTEVGNLGQREKGRQAYMVFTEAGSPYLFKDSMYHTYKNNGLSVRCVKD